MPAVQVIDASSPSRHGGGSVCDDAVSCGDDCSVTVMTRLSGLSCRTCIRTSNCPSLLPVTRHGRYTGNDTGCTSDDTRWRWLSDTLGARALLRASELLPAIAKRFTVP